MLERSSAPALRERQELLDPSTALGQVAPDLPEAPKRPDDAKPGRREWIVLTKDEKIRRKLGEQRTIIEADVRCFSLHPTKGMRADDMAEVLSAALPRILNIAEAEKRRGGFIKMIDRQGRIRHLLP